MQQAKSVDEAVAKANQEPLQYQQSSNGDVRDCKCFLLLPQKTIHSNKTEAVVAIVGFAEEIVSMRCCAGRCVLGLQVKNRPCLESLRAYTPRIARRIKSSILVVD